jgi:hypothetical protein
MNGIAAGFVRFGAALVGLVALGSIGCADNPIGGFKRCIPYLRGALHDHHYFER